MGEVSGEYKYVYIVDIQHTDYFHQSQLPIGVSEEYVYFEMRTSKSGQMRLMCSQESTSKMRLRLYKEVGFSKYELLGERTNSDSIFVHSELEAGEYLVIIEPTTRPNTLYLQISS